MCDILYILDILGVTGKRQRAYINLKDVLTVREGAEGGNDVLDLLCEHPFDVYFRLSPSETMVLHCDQTTDVFGRSLYQFQIMLYGGYGHTVLRLFSGDTMLFQRDLDEYLTDDKRNPYLKLYSADVSAFVVIGFLNTTSDSQMIAIIKGITKTGDDICLPGAYYYNDTSRELAGFLTAQFWRQFDITVTETLFMRWSEAKKIISPI